MSLQTPYSPNSTPFSPLLWLWFPKEGHHLISYSVQTGFYMCCFFFFLCVFHARSHRDTNGNRINCAAIVKGYVCLIYIYRYIDIIHDNGVETSRYSRVQTKNSNYKRSARQCKKYFYDLIGIFLSVSHCSVIFLKLSDTIRSDINRRSRLIYICKKEPTWLVMHQHYNHV